jgi:hypothetical protein
MTFLRFTSSLVCKDFRGCFLTMTRCVVVSMPSTNTAQKTRRNKIAGNIYCDPAIKSPAPFFPFFFSWEISLKQTFSHVGV